MKKLYVACSMSMYETCEYDQYLSQIRTDYPEYEILEPKLLYHSHREWIEGYEQIRKELDLFLFFLDQEGYIGRGVFTELCGLRCDKILLTKDGYKREDVYTFKRGRDNKQYVLVKVTRRVDSSTIHMDNTNSLVCICILLSQSALEANWLERKQSNEPNTLRYQPDGRTPY